MHSPMPINDIDPDVLEILAGVGDPSILTIKPPHRYPLLPGPTAPNVRGWGVDQVDREVIESMSLPEPLIVFDFPEPKRMPIYTDYMPTIRFPTSFVITDFFDRTVVTDPDRPDVPDLDQVAAKPPGAGGNHASEA